MGIESTENYYLLSETDNIFDQISNDLTGDKAKGHNVYTTLDTTLQKAAYKALGSNKGAVIVMESSTGKILAMVSKPDFDPNLVDKDYDKWINYDSSESVLLNRATQGLYAPGSTFKILTTLEYIREMVQIIHLCMYVTEVIMRKAEQQFPVQMEKHMESKIL